MGIRHHPPVNAARVLADARDACRGAEEAAALASGLARLQELTQLKLDLGGNEELGRGPQRGMGLKAAGAF